VGGEKGTAWGMTRNRSLTREKAIEQYLIFRVKFEEWMLLWNLVVQANQGRIQDPGYVLHPAVELEVTLFEIAVAWFATMVDRPKEALNVFDIWRVLFPEEAEVAEVEKALVPHLGVIRDLRNKAIFHAERNAAEYFKALITFSKEKDNLADPLARFAKLAKKLADSEGAAIPDLSERREKLREALYRDLPVEYSDSIDRLLGLAKKKT
jgi:hypothetical protein